MHPDTAKLLRDMFVHADAIYVATLGFDLDMFLRITVTQKAVLWDFAVIGEAMGRLRRIDPETAERITSSRRIIEFRNQLIHGYDIIRHSITWNVVTTYLPVLISELKTLLAEIDDVDSAD